MVKNNKQVAVIGDGRLTDDVLIEYAQKLGQKIAQLGYHLVCGGLGGLMYHACRGFKSVQGNGQTIGILPGHQFEQANDFIDIRACLVCVLSAQRVHFIFG